MAKKSKSVVKGTQGRKVNLVKTRHYAGVNKVRCLGCGIGYAVKVETTGGSIYRCTRCGREFADLAF